MENNINGLLNNFVLAMHHPEYKISQRIYGRAKEALLNLNLNVNAIQNDLELVIQAENESNHKLARHKIANWLLFNYGQGDYNR